MQRSPGWIVLTDAIEIYIIELSKVKKYTEQKWKDLGKPNLFTLVNRKLKKYIRKNYIKIEGK